MAWLIAGTIRVGGVPSRRLIHVHDKATGAFIDSGYSEEGTGYYSILCPNADPVYICVFEDPLNPRYESRVFETTPILVT